MWHTHTPQISVTYSNQAYRKQVLRLGSTHVALGFVDLGILLEAELKDPPTPKMNVPICFMGIEQSPCAVAKTLVILEMISSRREGIISDMSYKSGSVQHMKPKPKNI